VALAALACLAWVPAVVAEPSLVIESLGVRRGQVSASLRLNEAFGAETRDAIKQGLPITVRFTAEIWRARRHWFDKQVDSRVKSYRLRYHPGERLFSLTERGLGRRRQTFETLEQALEEASVRRIAIHPRWELSDNHAYFVTVEAAIQPLTLAEFRELEGWISGRIHKDGPPGESSEEPGESGGGLSGAFFDLLVDLSGFGDTIFRARTPSFRPADLPVLDRRTAAVPADDVD
jgi:hypothetical protein